MDVLLATRRIDVDIVLPVANKSATSPCNCHRLATFPKHLLGQGKLRENRDYGFLHFLPMREGKCLKTVVTWPWFIGCIGQHFDAILICFELPLLPPSRWFPSLTSPCWLCSSTTWTSSFVTLSLQFFKVWVGVSLTACFLRRDRSVSGPKCPGSKVSDKPVNAVEYIAEINEIHG